MFSNLKTKKRITQLLIAVLVVAITVTGSAVLLGDFVRKASAETYKVNVGSVSEWNSAVTNGATDIEITLTADIAATSKLTAIANGKNVTVNMNGKTIQWYNVASGNDNIMSTSYPLADTYWGMITNSGTLTLTGTGTVSQYHVRYENQNDGTKDNYGAKSAAIVNNGTLNIGSNITVENFLSQTNTKNKKPTFGSTKCQQMYLYSHAIFNDGTVNSSGKIISGSYAMAASSGDGNSYSVAFSYGIYGGNVNINGGSVYSEATSGLANVADGDKKHSVQNFAIGVCSNNAVILGQTNITTQSYSYRDNGNSNIWDKGNNMSWSIGVMYSDPSANGTLAPVIGPDVNISSSFMYPGDSDYTFSFPELSDKTNIFTYKAKCASEAGSYSRKAYAIVGIKGVFNDNMSGCTNAEADANNGGVYGNSISDFTVSTYYKTELYKNGGASSLATSSDNYSQSGANTKETPTSIINMGASGLNGGQFVVYYRYWDASGKNVVNYQTSPDTNVNSAVKFDIDTGVFTADSTTLNKTSGGEVTNSNYYEYLGVFQKAYADGEYNNGITKNNVTTKGAAAGDSLLLRGKKSYVIWVDYKALASTYVKVVAATTGTPINSDSTGTSFTTTYTGAPIVAGQDFNLGIIDMKYDTSADVDDTSDNTDITSSYAIKGVDEDGKLLVKYAYSSDGGSNYTDGLPKNVGKYKIKVTVPEDKDIARAGSGNRNGVIAYLDCEIKQGTPVISGPTSNDGTYGDTIASLIPFDKYTVATSSGQNLTGGTWSYTGYSNTDIPNAGTINVNLVWTPNESDTGNFKAANYTVTLNIAKRNSTVTPAASSVAYGTAAPKFTVNCTNLADTDKANLESWVNNSTFEVYYNNSWQEYSSTMTPGEYDIRIKSFGGNAENYNFDVSSTATAKLTITKAPILYTAVATNRTYNGTNVVDVKLTYASGAVNGDSVSNVINTTGTLTDANAGEAKAVKVVTSGISYSNSEKYDISVIGDVTVNIAKATPTVSIADSNRTYDSSVRLSDIAIDGTAKGVGNTDIQGTWSWVNSDTVPSVSVKSYKATFTPNDTVNYNTADANATINVSKKSVKITAEDKNVTFGDASPALTLKYDGFTGTDSINTIATTGTISVSTSYSKGSNAGTYPITVEVNEYEAENYEFTTENGTVTVGKRTIKIKPNDDSITFGDSKPTYSVSDISVVDGELYGTDTLESLNSTAKFSVTTDYAQDATNGKVGTYNITVTATDTTNYTFTCESATLTVKKATLTVKANDKAITYLDNAPETSAYTYVISGYKYNETSEKASLTGTAGFTTKYTKGDVVGNYSIEISVGTLNHPNYDFEFVNGTLTVGKYTLNTSSASVTATIAHDELYSSAVFGSNSFNDGTATVNGTFTLNDSSKKADYTTATVVSGQSYRTVTATATFTPVDSANYNSVEIQVQLRINPHEVTGAPVIKGSPVENQTISVNVATMTPSNEDSYTYQWYVGGSKVTGETGKTYTIKTADIDKEIYVEVTAKTENGYTGVKTSAKVTAVKGFNKFVSINELNVNGTGSFVFDGSTHNVTVTPKNGYVSSDITVYYNGSTEAPRNAGTYKVTVDVGTPNVADESTINDYYGPVSGLEVGTITITKANVTVNVTVDNKTYDGTVNVNNYKADLEKKDNLSLDSELASVTFADAAAGSNKSVVAKGFKLSGTDAGNYELVIKTNTPTINKRELKVIAYGVGREYNKSTAVDVNIVVDSSSYASVDSAATVSVYSATATSLSANVGNQFIKDIIVELTGSSKDNYTVVITNSETAQVTISQAASNPDSVTVSGLVYDANRTLASVTIEQPADGTWTFDNTSIVPTVNQKTYSATFVPTDKNYKAYNGYITVDVSPKEVTLTADNKSVVYGKTIGYTYTASGFTGSDSLDTMGGTKPTCNSEYYVGQSVGDYDIDISHNLDSNGNYTFTVVKGKLTVTPATIYVNATAVDRDYNGTDTVTVNFAIESGKYGNDEVVLSTTTVNGVAASANAGTRTVSYVAPTLVGAKASNYNIAVTPSTGVLTVKINKINPTGVIFPISATVEFSRDLSTAVFDESAVGENGTFEFVNKTLPESLSTHVREIMFVPTDSVNYNNLYSNVNLTVTECVLNYVVGISGTEQVGQKLNVSITGMPAMANDYIHYQWFRLDSNGEFTRINTANESTYTLTEQDKGYTICVMTYFDNNAPYVFDDGVAETVDEITGILGATINTIKEENLSFWQRLIKWIQSIIDAITGITWAM